LILINDTLPLTVIEKLTMVLDYFKGTYPIVKNCIIRTKNTIADIMMSKVSTNDIKLINERKIRVRAARIKLENILQANISEALFKAEKKYLNDYFAYLSELRDYSDAFIRLIETFYLHGVNVNELEYEQ